MTDQPTELTLLHDAMVECGIWPDEIRFIEGMVFYCSKPLANNGLNWNESERLVDKHALHIMRGIAEEWLLKQWDTVEINRHSKGTSYDFSMNIYHREDSLPAALCHAHEQKENQ